jgi:hypothetical protein
MTPEILHRCESCGVAVRERDALFCPECGKPLAVTKLEETPNDQSSPGPSSEGPTSTAEQAKPDSSTENRAATADQTVAVDPAKMESEPARAATLERHGARERTRETLHRASTAARGAIERPVKQVEKIHHVSTVMLEEAHYDPSLRFVLVALGLFILFVILLVLSKVMG